MSVTQSPEPAPALNDSGAKIAAPAGSNRFIARQPILDRKSKTFGYELLFRSGTENLFLGIDGDKATQMVLDNVFLLGLDSLTDGKLAFINCTTEFLLNGMAALLPKERVVLEVLETVETDEKIFWACDDLKNAGYRIALDDFTASQSSHLLLPLADFIKVDFLQTTPAERMAFAERFIPAGIHLLAEKVENQEESELAMKLGYEYCQGYFFAKPMIITGRDIPAFKLNLLRILQEASRADFDQDRLEATLKHEASVCYRLLKYLNTFAFSFCRQITSLRHGLILLGEGNIRRWLSLVATTALGQDRPSELVLTCLTRARGCELLAEAAGMAGYETDLFLAGMLSTMDALLGRPLASILDELRVCDHITSALTDRSGPLYPVVNAILAVESGDWNQISLAASAAGVGEDQLSDTYIHSIEWAQAVFKA